MIFSRYAVAAVVGLVGICWGADGLAQESSGQRPRNVILMIADGQGFNGWLATDYYSHGEAGKEPYMRPRPDGTRPHVGAVMTGSLQMFDGAGAETRVAAEARSVRRMPYDPTTRWADFGSVSQATDSAAASTVLHTGRRTTNTRLGLAWDGETRLTSVAALARRQGMATGAVTSVQFAHATPAGAGVQTASRHDYDEVARQMLDGRLDVVMGAGHPLFDDDGRPVAPDAVPDEAWEWAGGRDYVERLLAEGRSPGGLTLIQNREDFERLAQAGPSEHGGMEPLVGLTQVRQTLQFRRADGADLIDGTPTLSVMAQGALNRLSASPKGFFVMIEGGAVDWANHANNAGRMVEEHAAFNEAVNAVVDWVEAYSSWDETLLIITADHETGMLWGPGAWTDVDGDGVWSEGDTFHDYALPSNNGQGQIPGVSYGSPHHTNELVPLFAMGVGASMFEGMSLRDEGARRLWGEAYDWDGGYVDNTDVFLVMHAVMTGAAE
ncbi:alkaline phosphatase [Brevundimonas sp.]|uniref:alkaline phosphatase n=1 Tax=Brevundimonas sp. TaxID=1871086 RepID=UPI00391ABB04